MNRWQVSRQLRHLLRAATWTGGTERVFGMVLVSAAPAEDEILRSGRWPIAIVRPGAGEIDPEYGEEPTLLRTRFTLDTYVQVAGDPLGETAAVGSHRTVGGLVSDGRGILELDEVVYATVEHLAGVDGVEAQVKAATVLEAAYDDEIGYVARQQHVLEVLCTHERFYHPPTRLAATIPGGGQLSLTWTVPPDRFDRYRVVLRRAAGATPPASITAGTGVTLSANLATSVTDTPGVGQFSYALFGTYDEVDTLDDGAANSDDRVSASDTVTATAT